MLPASQRLSAKKVSSLMEKGRVAHSPLFVMRYSAGMPRTRIAAIVPKKIAAKPAVRNKMRRRIYEAIKAAFPRLQGIEPGTEAALLAKSGLRDADLEAVKHEIIQLFSKAGLVYS